MRYTILCCGILLLAAASCKKENEQEPEICRITTADIIQGSDSSRLTLTYDTRGRLTSTVGNGQRTTFTYNGNVVRVQRSGDTWGGYDSIILNSNNQIIIQYSYYSTGSGNYRADYTYKGTEVQRRITQTLSGIATPDTTVYEWSDGNMVREVYGPNHFRTYSYDTGKPVVDNSDMLRFGSLITTGGYVVLSRNLLSNVPHNFSLAYDLDSKGLILVAHFTIGSASARNRFGYTCQ